MSKVVLLKVHIILHPSIHTSKAFMTPSDSRVQTKLSTNWSLNHSNNTYGKSKLNKTVLLRTL